MGGIGGIAVIGVIGVIENGAFDAVGATHKVVVVGWLLWFTKTSIYRLLHIWLCLLYFFFIYKTLI